MKKLLSLILVAVMVASCIGVSAVATQTIKGDVNSDNEINIKDVLLIRKYYVGHSVAIDSEASDFNSDSKINGIDILLIRKKIAEIESLPDGIPSTYANVLTSNIQVNQIGYETSSVKTAKLTESINVNKADTNISQIACFVVDTATDNVVYTGLSTTRKYDSNTSRFVSTFDFSSVQVNGTYKIVAPEGYSYSFEICDNPYKRVQDALITALYYNRCGDALSSPIVEEKFTHDVCHSGDVPVYILNKLDTDPNSATYGKYIQSSVAKASDFLGGLHDAGDYGRYTTPANQVVADLLLTYEMYGESADCKVLPNSTSDLLEEAKHEMKWLLTMQNQQTGGVYWRIATKEFVAYGNPPDNDTYFNNTGLYVSHETLKATAGFVGAAAMCARVFKDIDESFANKCLDAAIKGYAYVKANMENADAHKGFTNESEYPSINAGSYGDNAKAWSDIWWATCELFRTTGESKYNEDAKSLFQRKNNNEIGFSLCDISAYSIGGAGSFAYVSANGADEDIKTSILTALKTYADENKKIATSDKYNIVLKDATEYNWGSNQIMCVKLKVMAMVDYFNKTNDYEAVMRDAVCYVLGRNAINKSYITRYGSDTPKDICHSPSAHLRVKYNLYTPAPGFMVGGAFPNGSTYEDNHDNYACNEVCVYWNSSAILTFGYVVSVDSAK